MTCGRSVTVTLALRVAATAIPTRAVPDPSSRILRLRCLGLSKDLPEPTHPLPPIELDPPPAESTAPAVGDEFHSPKPKINGLEIGSPPLKSKKPDSTDPSFSQRVVRFFWVDPASFECSLGRFKLHPARFR